MFKMNRRFGLVDLVVTAATAAVIVLAFILFVDWQKPANICGEATTVKQDKPAIQYLPENSGLRGTSIRTLTMGKNGLWIGYAGGAGVSHFDGPNWRFCGQIPQVNAIALDAQGNPWVGTDAPLVGTPPAPQKSLMHFENGNWVDFTSKLPDYRVYGLTMFDGSLYVATWEGVGAFDGTLWTEPYSLRTGTLINGVKIHAVAFPPNHREAWFGTIDRGVVLLNAKGLMQVISAWKPDRPTELQVLGGDNIRKITVSPSGEQVWFAADPGDVTMYDYSTNKWTRYAIPGARQVNDVEFDSASRPCVATTDPELGGVYCLDDGVWKNLFSAPTYAIAFGCDGCAFGRDEFFAGTVEVGLVRGKILPHK